MTKHTSKYRAKKPRSPVEKRRRRKRRQFGEKASRLFFWSWFLLFLPVVLIIGAGYLSLTADLPDISDLKKNYRPPTVTTVYSDDHQKIAEFYEERRFVVPLSQMPKKLIQAFVAAEDARFFDHRGVDLFSILRATFKNLEAGEVVQGASTITQQVARSFYLSAEKTYRRKFKEALLAYRIDRNLTKEEILFLYLNQIYLGYGAYGVAAAADSYFGKSLKDLSLAEIATLAGLPPAPSTYSPAHYPERAKKRREYVLRRMLTEGHITEYEANRAEVAPMTVAPRRNWYMEKAPYYAEHVRREVEARYGSDALYKDGLQIYTAVDLDLQSAARTAVDKGLLALDKRQGFYAPAPDDPDDAPSQTTEGALICVETETGRVKAMIGGRDFSRSQFNRAVQSHRQPGSSFKPIIYAAALDKGYTPLTVLSDTPLVYGNGYNSWAPSNYDHRFLGPVRLRKAIALSRNIPVIRVLQDIGVDYAIDYAHQLGIGSPLARNLSLALGSSGVSLMDMVTAYSVFANQGKLVHPRFITRILDRNGKENPHLTIEPEQAIEPSTAYLMTSLLESVVKEGTGRRARVLDRPVAGKTGTTNDFRDAWFLGYTPHLVAGAWVGFDQERSLGYAETGSRAACPIWLEFMKTAVVNHPKTPFLPPDSVVLAEINRHTGLRAAAEGPHTFTEYFKQGTVPQAQPPARLARKSPPVEPDPKPVKQQEQTRQTRPAVIATPEDFFKSGI